MKIQGDALMMLIGESINKKAEPLAERLLGGVPHVNMIARPTEHGSWQQAERMVS